MAEQNEINYYKNKLTTEKKKKPAAPSQRRNLSST